MHGDGFGLADYGLAVLAALVAEETAIWHEENRQHELTGKAMIVAYSRAIAMKIYRKLLELRPAWSELVGVVMTESNCINEC